MDKLLWNKLNEQSINIIIEYLTLFEKKNINKYYYTNANSIINISKFKILKWYNHHRLLMNTEIDNDPFLTNASFIRLKHILIFSYPVVSIIDTMYYIGRAFNKNIKIYLEDYYIENYEAVIIDNDLEFDFTSIPNIKKIWKQFINDCVEHELRTIV